MTRTNVMVLGLLFPMLGFSAWLKVDDFQSRDPGANLKGVDGWHVDGSAAAIVGSDPAQPENRAMQMRLSKPDAPDHQIVFHRGYLHIEPGKTGSIFLRFRLGDGLMADGKVQTARLSVCISEAGLNAGCPCGGVLIQGVEPQISGVDAKKGLKLKRQQWYKLWMVVESQTGATARGKAWLQEDAPGATRMEVPGGTTPARTRPILTLSCLGFINDHNYPATDRWVDDIFIDNSGVNESDPLREGASQSFGGAPQQALLTVPFQSGTAGSISKTTDPLDALNATDVYQGMYPTDTSMPVPRFPAFRVLPVLATHTGFTLAKEYPDDKHLSPNLPALKLSVALGEKNMPFFSGTADAQIAHRTGNLLKLVDTSAPLSRSLEMAVVSHQLVLLRLRMAGSAAELKAEWSGTGTCEPMTGTAKGRVMTNPLGTHSLEILPGATRGEAIIALTYEARSAEAFKAAVDTARKLASQFDELWARLAKPQALEPFLTGSESALERNLVAANVNRVLRNQRASGRISRPSLVEFYGPEWATADNVWMWFLPACRYTLWIEPTFWANSIDVMLDAQGTNGCVPQMVGQRWGGSEDPKTSQNPNISPVVCDYYRFTGDRKFLARSYPRLKGMYQWFLKNRDPNASGLFAIGHESLSLNQNISEYGRDNGPTHHGEIPAMRGVPGIEYRQERLYLLDILACQARLAEDLAFMAKELGDTEGAAHFTAEYERVRAWVNKNMWDEQTKFYYTVVRSDGRKVMRRLNAAFWMLWAGIPDQRQKDELVKALFDPQQFFAPIPIPQLALNDPAFNPKVGHWGDGHSWPIDASTAFDGLLRYGEWDKAAEFARHYNQGVFKAIEKTYQPSEWYHSSGLAHGCRIMGTAGCLPLTFQRYLRDHRAGRAAEEWSRFAPTPLFRKIEK